ncbi:hypothetical protein SAMN05421684_7255 [Asanoa ishikariensis]|uniref:Uncharacterized protein n=1 Tax=Asanoa ishikariensis TaxID=137265 RepID=A0A1H3UGQ1_9ACTN|nr:hypothetical protein SAMN05421684_7255 [Asanoa ishikariensis]
MYTPRTGTSSARDVDGTLIATLEQRARAGPRELSPASVAAGENSAAYVVSSRRPTQSNSQKALE